MWGCVSELLVFSLFIHSLKNYVQRFCDKMKVTQSTLKNDMPWTGKTDKQAISTQSHKYEDIKDGTRNAGKGQPALCQYCQLFGGGDMYVAAWRTGESTGDGGEKHVQRPEVRKGICGIPHSLAGQMQSWGAE